MKLKYIFLLLCSMFVIQSCGSGGGGSDTSGVLTMTSPTVTGGAKIGDFAGVSYTVTYTPPAGKVPNGVIIKQTIFDQFGTVVFGPTDFQLNSNTSFDTGFTVLALGVQQFYSIHLSIGTMTAGSGVVIPAGTP